MISELVTARHLSRKAVVYIRQSHPQQVVNNQESLRLQDALRQRACDLGWDEADVEVVDADLGLSGAAADHRHGELGYRRQLRTCRVRPPPGYRPLTAATRVRIP